MKKSKFWIRLHHLPSGSIYTSVSEEADDQELLNVEKLLEQVKSSPNASFQFEGEEEQIHYFPAEVVSNSIITLFKEKIST